MVCLSPSEARRLCAKIRKLCNGFILDWDGITDGDIIAMSPTKTGIRLLKSSALNDDWKTLSVEVQKARLAPFRSLRQQMVSKIRKLRYNRVLNNFKPR